MMGTGGPVKNVNGQSQSPGHAQWIIYLLSFRVYKGCEYL